jgi:hypothetical protein
VGIRRGERLLWLDRFGLGQRCEDLRWRHSGNRHGEGLVREAVDSPPQNGQQGQVRPIG